MRSGPMLVCMTRIRASTAPPRHARACGATQRAAGRRRDRHTAFSFFAFKPFLKWRLRRMNRVRCYELPQQSRRERRTLTFGSAQSSLITSRAPSASFPSAPAWPMRVPRTA